MLGLKAVTLTIIRAYEVELEKPYLEQQQFAAHWEDDP